MSQVAIRLQGVRLGYKDVTVLDGVDLELHAGKVVAIVGDNGTGKTTLLRALAGVLAPLQGRRSVTQGLRLGYVPQQAQLDSIFPYTVAEIVGQGLARGPGLPRAQLAGRTQVHQALVQVGLADRAQRLFSELSGGQKQRVLLARATVLPVDLLFLDEPTAGVDRHAVAKIQRSMQGFIQAGTGLVVVTHQPEYWQELVHDWCEIAGARVRMRSAGA